ncbi:MAG: hypothetical protein K1X67_17285 [Fimbriimonadaceae bacterium]|nr:hypothetical protein [Fimbriimonadaceae bacterium]
MIDFKHGLTRQFALENPYSRLEDRLLRLLGACFYDEEALSYDEEGQFEVLERDFRVKNGRPNRG